MISVGESVFHIQWQDSAQVFGYFLIFSNRTRNAFANTINHFCNHNFNYLILLISSNWELPNFSISAYTPSVATVNT